MSALVKVLLWLALPVALSAMAHGQAPSPEKSFIVHLGGCSSGYHPVPRGGTMTGYDCVGDVIAADTAKMPALAGPELQKQLDRIEKMLKALNPTTTPGVCTFNDGTYAVGKDCK